MGENCLSRSMREEKCGRSRTGFWEEYLDLSRKKYTETGEKRTIISLVILSSTQNIKGYLIKEEEIDGVRCTHGEKRNA